MILNYSTRTHAGTHTHTHTHSIITCKGEDAGISGVHHLLMWWTQTFLELCLYSVTVYIYYFVGFITSDCICWQARRRSFLCGSDEWQMCCGLRLRVLVCSQDPCAGSQRWIKVTGTTISCSCGSHGTQSALQTLVLYRGQTQSEGWRREDGSAVNTKVRRGG